MLGPTINATRISSIILALSAATCALPGYAVCFYPHSTRSGYHIPLQREIRDSPVIIIGKVAHARNVQADPNDPNGVTSYVYMIRRLKTLKGTIPKYLTLRAENDSGGYRMAVGETQLLFLTRIMGGFSVDACGNSTDLPKGADVLAETLGVLSHHGAGP